MIHSNNKCIYKKLYDVCKIIGGGTPSKSNHSFYEGNILWATVRDMKNDIITDTEFKINTDAVKYSSTNIIPKNNIVIASRVGLGKACYLKYDTAINQDLKAVIPNNLKQLDVFYLFWWFKSLSNTIEKAGTGATVKGIKLPFINNLLIPLPPLDEQKRIVSILDKVFAGIEKAKANTEKNLKNSRELFDSYLQNIFARPGKDWEKKKLGEVTTKIGSGATPLGGEKSYKQSGISLIRSLNVHDNGFRIKNLAFIDDKQASALDNVSIESDDVLINITGASVSRCCIVPKSILPARVNQHVSIIRTRNHILYPYYLHYLLISKEYKDKLLKIGEAGATRQALTKLQLENFTINYPKDITEQKKIVAKLDALSAETKKLEAIYQKKLEDLEELKKSVLQKAFNGEL
jgi:type I restriction enzyme S subunit